MIIGCVWKHTACLMMGTIFAVVGVVSQREASSQQHACAQTSLACPNAGAVPFALAPSRQRMFTEPQVPPLQHLLCLLLFWQRLADGQQRSESSLWGMGTQSSSWHAAGNGPTARLLRCQPRGSKHPAAGRCHAGCMALEPASSTPLNTMADASMSTTCTPRNSSPTPPALCWRPSAHRRRPAKLDG